MQTCDVLDATYKLCPQADIDCIFDEELDCLTKKQQCDDFDPPCPAGQYQVSKEYGGLGSVAHSWSHGIDSAVSKCLGHHAVLPINSL